MELIDTSALILGARDPRLRDWFADALRLDALAICDIVALEYVMGARNTADYERLMTALAGFTTIATEPADWARAREAHRRLAERGHGEQRSFRIPDLIIAAVAERSGLAVLHYDEDYDRIAAITGQATRWVLPRASA